MSATASDSSREVARQRRYYADTAARYEAMHLHDGDEHTFALSIMLGLVDGLGVRTILDVGSGTGRALKAVREQRPDLAVRGVEPVRELREVGYASGIPRADLIDGDALALPVADRAVDLVCAFGVLHHIRRPELAVAEMLRVSRIAIFISDANNFGQGSAVMRAFKQALNACGLWPLANYLKTRGRGYTFSEGDGLAYSYSIFNNYAQIARECRVHLFNTDAAGANLYRTASHLALLGVKR